MATSYYAYSIVIDDAPLPPEIIRSTLKQKSLWQAFIARPRYMTPQRFMESFNQEKQKLTDKVKKGDTLTQEDCDFLTRNTQERIEKVLDDFKEHALSEMEIKRPDTAKLMKLKTDFATTLIEWLQNLLAWVPVKIQEVFARLKEATDWCMEKAKEFFEYLWSLLT